MSVHVCTVVWRRAHVCLYLPHGAFVCVYLPHCQTPSLTSACQTACCTSVSLSVEHSQRIYTYTHTHTHTLRTGYDGGRHLTVLRILAMAHHAYVGVTQLPENTESVNTSHLGILGFAVGVSTVLHKFKPTNPSMLDTVSQVLLPTPTLPSPTSAAGSLAPSGGGGGEGEGGGGGGGGMAEDSDCPGMARVWLQVCVCVCVRVCVYA
jgi:hypothetical protein